MQRREGCTNSSFKMFIFYRSVFLKISSFKFGLKTLEEFERQKVADAMEPKEFEDGEIIIQQVLNNCKSLG